MACLCSKCNADVPARNPDTRKAHMNIFDAIVVALTLIAVVMGYSAGLLRSLATILGYAVAAPFAVLLTPKLAPLLPNQNGFLFFVVFLVTGVVMGALMRSTVRGLAGGGGPGWCARGGG